MFGFQLFLFPILEMVIWVIFSYDWALTTFLGFDQKVCLQDSLSSFRISIFGKWSFSVCQSKSFRITSWWSFWLFQKPMQSDFQRTKTKRRGQFCKRFILPVMAFCLRACFNRGIKYWNTQPLILHRTLRNGSSIKSDKGVT